MDLSSIEDTKKTYGYKPSRCQNCDEYFDPSFLPVHLNNCGPTTIQQEKEPSRCHNCDEYFDLGEVIAAAEPPLPPLPGRQAVLHSSFYRESIN